MDVKLVQVSGVEHQVYPVDSDDFVIGREFSCHLRPDHGKVSQRHCRIFKKYGRIYVEDLNSGLGTSVNGEEVGEEPLELSHGADLRVGPLHYRVAFGDRPLDDAAGVPVVPGATRAKRSPADSSVITPVVQSARDLLGRMTGHDEPEPERAVSRREAHTRLEVADSGDVSLVRIVPRSVVHDHEIRALDEQLDGLIQEGRKRIALSFRNVEHFSSQAIGTMIRTQRRCQSHGGHLRICQLRPQVAEVFAITNLDRVIEIYPEETPAVQSPWPAHAGDAGGGSPPLPLRVRLVVEVGKNKGKMVEIPIPRFAIGRDPSCQLRPSSESVAPQHAVIEQRDGKVFVRDCGTEPGTIVGERILHDAEVEVHHRDALQIGALQFTLSIEPWEAH